MSVVAANVILAVGVARALSIVGVAVAAVVVEVVVVTAEVAIVAGVEPRLSFVASEQSRVVAALLVGRARKAEIR
jgi:hypothetical protein